MEMQRGISSLNPRRDVERERRQRMNALYSRLASFIPSKEKLQVGVLLDQATSYVVKLKQNVEDLKRRKELLTSDEGDQKESLVLPALTVREMGSILEVNLITGVQNNNFKLYRALAVLEDEGLQVLSASHSALGQRMLYTINSQVVNTRIGVEASRVYERLNKLLCSTTT